MLCSAILVLNGCGSSTANVITVTVNPSSQVVIAGQVATFTATVGGSTNTTVTNWTCTYVYTPLPTTAVPNPKPTTAATCTSGQTIAALANGSIGTWSSTTTNGSNVLTYTAPPLSKFPNPAPQLTFTAAADADKKKTGTTIIALDSGIRVSITPGTATVPVGLTPAQTTSFNASFLNSPSTGQIWKLVQPNSSSTTVADQTANPLSDSCDPTCGTIDNNGVFTAPATLPTDTKPAGSKSTTPTTVYAVVNSSADTVHYAVATITLVNATTHPITFNSISPSTIPVGGQFQDIFLNAHNLLNTTKISFAPQGTPIGTGLPIDSTNIFTIPVSLQYCTPSATGVTPVVTCDASLLTRIRLTPDKLTKAGTGYVTIAGIPCNPTATQACTVTTSSDCILTVDGGGTTASVSCPLDLVYTSPALVAAAPDSFPEGGTATLVVNGGYFGTSGNNVQLLLDGVTDNLNGTNPSGPRQLVGTPQGSQLPIPGLVQVSVKVQAPAGSTPLFPIKTTNIAVQPTFTDLNSIYHPPGVTPPPTITTIKPPIPLGAGSLAPSSIVIDSAKGFAVITEQGANQMQFVNLSASGPSLGSIFPTGTAPTAVVIDDQIQLPGYAGQDLGVVVNSADNTIGLYAFSATTATDLHKAFKVDLATLIGQPGATGLSTPYAIGVDPGTHLGVVVYQNTNIAFIVDVNPNLDGSDSRACFLGGKPPCVVAPVSLTTGADPHVVMQPGAPIAYVTPGGSGSTSVVDLLQQGKSATIAGFMSGGTSGAVRTNGIVKIITTSPHGINPALGGTVIIAGLLPADLNGTFQVIPGSITDPYTFSYAQLGATDETETNTTVLGTVQYGTPYYSFNTSIFASGAAINPITRTFAYADYNSSSQQIGFIGTLDQTLNTLSLSGGSCFNCTGNSGAPEIGFRSVAFDPYTNVLIAYDPSVNVGANFVDNSISLINPGGPGIGGNTAPYRIIAAISTGQAGTGTYTPAGQTTAVTVNGPMGYDPKTRYVLVANAGSNTLTYLNLDQSNTFKKLAIQSIQVTSAGVANGQPQLAPTGPHAGLYYPPATCDPTNATLTCMPQAVPLGQPATVKIFGQGFLAGGAVARLDTSINLTPTFLSDSEIDITIPASLLTLPHDYSLDVVAGGVTSNAVDLYAIGILPMGTVCTPTTAFPQGPEAVAIDSILHVAFVTNYACNSVSAIAIQEPAYTKKDGTTVPYGTVLSTVTVGPNPIGIAVSPRLGLTVVANSGDTPTGSASIIDSSNPEALVVKIFTTTSGTTTTTAKTVPVGIFPLGVTIDEDHALALIANNGSNTLTSIDLSVLLPGAVTDTTPTPTTVAINGSPTAIAVDPNRAVAVVTTLQNSGTSSASGGLDVVNLSTQPPARSTSASVGSLTASLTGIAFDAAPSFNTPNAGTAVFYATSTQQNAIYSFNPDSGSTQLIRVGINPYGLAYNPQTGTILTINSTSNTSSIIDSQNFKTRNTLGISSLSQFPVAMDTLTNTVVIADQNNNRVIFLPVPK